MSLSKHDFDQLCSIVASTKDEDLLNQIIDSSSTFSGRHRLQILCAMATNPNLSFELQEKLVSLPIARIKCHLIHSENLDERVLRKIATSKVRHTAELAIRHKNASEIVNRYYLMGKYKRNA